MASWKPTAWIAHAEPWAEWLLQQAFPPRCPACHMLVEAQHNFCNACFDALQHIADPQCESCGTPFAFAIDTAMQCPECLATPPHFDSARAPLIYDATSAPIIRALKFHDRYTGLNRSLSMMLSALGERRGSIDTIVPVPLHWRRLIGRRYNQSALLAYGMAARLGKPCLPHALKRTRYTKPQMRMKRAERLKNARHLFAARAALHGKHVLLIDDVITTGATVNACAHALKQAGAASVHALALARTVRS